MKIEQDEQFQTETVEKISDLTADGFTVHFRVGMALSVKSRVRPEPSPGETIRLYGKGFGFPVRGLAVGERVYYYESEEQYTERMRIEAHKRLQEQRAEWQANLCKTLDRVARLPQPFQDRFNAFRNHSPDFGPKFAEQRRAFPQLDPGHSGNSFGAMLTLAVLYIQSPELVPQMHGALCPLVGCEEYGCYASRREQKETA